MLCLPEDGLFRVTDHNYAAMHVQILATGRATELAVTSWTDADGLDETPDLSCSYGRSASGKTVWVGLAVPLRGWPA